MYVVSMAGSASGFFLVEIAVFADRKSRASMIRFNATVRLAGEIASKGVRQGDANVRMRASHGCYAMENRKSRICWSKQNPAPPVLLLPAFCNVV